MVKKTSSNSPKKKLSKDAIRKLAMAAKRKGKQGLSPKAMKRLAAAKKKKEELAKEIKKQMEDVKKKASKFKDKALKEYKDEIVGITVLPPRPKQRRASSASPQRSGGKNKKGKQEKGDPELLVLLNIEEENTKKLIKKKKAMSKKLKSLRSDAIKDINMNVLVLKEVWDACEKGKYEILRLVTIGMPVYDDGWLTAIKSVEMHKAQVIKKFEKYVICYVMAGSVLRGEAKEGSDLDTFVVIDDTDVTRMTGQELKSKLTSIIWGMAAQATMQTGGKYKIHTQIYLLSQMWKSINLAHPVIFTFIREGVPLYDRGMFMPWKMLLRKGQVKSTPEAIRGYVKSGKKSIKKVKKKLKKIATQDLFYATSIPAQGALMLEGKEPPVPWHTPGEFNKHFVEKRGLMKKEDTEVLTRNLKMLKGVEHGEIKDINPKDVIKNLKDSEKFLEKIEKLFEKLQKEKVKEEAKEAHKKIKNDVEAALSMLDSKKSKSLHSDLKKHIVKEGLASARLAEVFKEIEEADKKHNVDIEEIAKLRFEEEKLANEMFDRIRAKKGGSVEKFKLTFSYKGGKKQASVWLLGEEAYVIFDNADPKTDIKKYEVSKSGELKSGKSVSLDAVNDAAKKFTGKPAELSDILLDSIKKVLSKDAKLVVGA